MQYLLKVTIIWTFLLLLFELLFKNNARYLANRIYLAGSLLAGILIPLVKLPHAVSSNSIVRSAATAWTTGNATAIQAPGQLQRGGLDWQHLLLFGYIAGAALFLVVSLREIGIILRHAIYGSYQTVAGHKLFVIDKQIPPHSFMGWIFVSSYSGYDKSELDLILTHEAAHNRQKHWLDLLLVQAVCILCWFHPLVWRFRYLLRLQHEYEADAIASGDDAYTYGHFLLQQTLLKGTPFVAHSFHFSPIKNRINMLTQKQSHRIQGWKYLMVLPALFACTLLMAKAGNNAERIRKGNMVSYNGNDFYWLEQPADTVELMDPVTNQTTRVVATIDPVITRMNKEEVETNKLVSVQAQFRNNNRNFSEYLKEQFIAVAKNVPDSIRQIRINNIVLSKEGKIRYYELQFVCRNSKAQEGLYEDQARLTPLVDQLIADSPDWLPASHKGKAVNVFIPHNIVIALKPMNESELRYLSE